MDTVETYKRNFLFVAPVAAAAVVLLSGGDPANAAEEAAAAAAVPYEPSPLDMSVVYGQLGVVAACAGVFTFYWNGECRPWVRVGAWVRECVCVCGCAWVRR